MEGSRNDRPPSGSVLIFFALIFAIALDFSTEFSEARIQTCNPKESDVDCLRKWLPGIVALFAAFSALLIGIGQITLAARQARFQRLEEIDKRLDFIYEIEGNLHQIISSCDSANHIMKSILDNDVIFYEKQDSIILSRDLMNIDEFSRQISLSYNNIGRFSKNYGSIINSVKFFILPLRSLPKSSDFLSRVKDKDQLRRMLELILQTTKTSLYECENIRRIIVTERDILEAERDKATNFKL
ncbi:hypothetical protein ACTZWW_17080 [Salinarimonas sp. NSM]|uniref:hypothetical protein n=1 Tax=Salinarimonas sp. NSM TaxID=3458003 RepID=UPI0040372DF3